MTDHWRSIFGDEPEKPQPKNKGGRPRGSKNKTAEQKMMEGKLKTLFKRIEHMLDPEQRAYMQDVVNGRVKFDAIKEAELLIRYMSVYTSAILEGALGTEDEPVASVKASQDIAKVLAEYRMGIKDIEEMKRKREEMQMKSGENERMVDPTRESAMARFQSIHGEHSS